MTGRRALGSDPYPAARKLAADWRVRLDPDEDAALTGTAGRGSPDDLFGGRCHILNTVLGHEECGVERWRGVHVRTACPASLPAREKNERSRPTLAFALPLDSRMSENEGRLHTEVRCASAPADLSHRRGT